jgi:hypothetical protein
MDRLAASDALPALLDALGYIGTGVLVVCDCGKGLERLYSNEPAAQILGYTHEELQALAPLRTGSCRSSAGS